MATNSDGKPTGFSSEIEDPRAPSFTIRMLTNHRVRIGAAIILGLAVIAVFAPILAPADPASQSLAERLQPPGYRSRAGLLHVLGTDQLGRDVLSRIFFGARVPLIIGFASAGIGALIGLTVGLPAGYFGRWLDGVASWMIDFQLSLPFILVALTVVALFGRSQTIIVLAFALTSWGTTSRVARSSAFRLKNMPFVEAERALGATDRRILLGNVLPNAIGPILVVASVQVAEFIVFEAALGFFGLGVPPPAPTWGNMLADARQYLGVAWWLGLFPGLAIATAALAAHVLGDGVREVLDPGSARSMDI